MLILRSFDSSWTTLSTSFYTIPIERVTGPNLDEAEKKFEKLMRQYYEILKKFKSILRKFYTSLRIFLKFVILCCLVKINTD